MATMNGRPELVVLGRGGRGDERYTSREMIATEARLEQSGGRQRERGHQLVGADHVYCALDATEGRGLGGGRTADGDGEAAQAFEDLRAGGSSAA